MKTTHKIWMKMGLIFAVLLGTLPGYPIMANEIPEEGDQFKSDSIAYRSYSATVKDAESGQALLFATVMVKGTNIATVTNSDGAFTIKIPVSQKADQLEISYVGYETQKVALSELNQKKNVVKLTMATIPLDLINIFPDDANLLMRKVMQSIPQNYPLEPNMMKGFYRETIKRNRSHVGIAEAVVEIYKSDYNSMRADQVKIYKGRKKEDVTKMDTLVFRLQGGPATALMLDIIKNPVRLLEEVDRADYIYKIENVVELDGKAHFVVGFKQKGHPEFPLYDGKYYIEAHSLALSRAEFSLNLEDENAATKMLILKKPAGLRVTTKEVTYLVNYKEQNDKWYFNSARGEMAFKFNWKRKLFNTNYQAMLEIAITDRSDNPESIVRYKSSERFRTNQLFSEEVSSFEDEDFWGANNTIQPDESIQATIDKLNRKGKF